MRRYRRAKRVLELAGARHRWHCEQHAVRYFRWLAKQADERDVRYFEGKAAWHAAQAGRGSTQV